MLKRLIEVAFPLFEVSEQSGREKSIRQGHISTLHMWWARRPLAACRAVIFASLIPDPDDPDCPEAFRKSVNDTLGRSQFKPHNENGSTVHDTPRNRCLELIKHLVLWENMNNTEYIEPAQQLISAAHAALDSQTGGELPIVLDPVGGGGSIPLEALRLGCESHAIDLNPVAHLIQLCTLVYPQLYAQPSNRPFPQYIRLLGLVNKERRRTSGETSLFDQDGNPPSFEESDVAPDTDISEQEYHSNPLAADLKYWGAWVMKSAQREIGKYYPVDSDGGVPVAYLWVRTVKCPNPSCAKTIPMFTQTWLCVTPRRKVAFRFVLDEKSDRWHVDVAENESIDFDPTEGTMKRGQAVCLRCQTVANSKYLQKEGYAGKIGQFMTCVVTVRAGQSGKNYRSANDADRSVFEQAKVLLTEQRQKHGSEIIPEEDLKVWSGVFNAPLFGMDKWHKLFNERQLLALTTLVRHVGSTVPLIAEAHDSEYARALGTYLGVAVSRLSNFMSTLCAFNHTGGRGVANTFGRQALRMAWEYAESAGSV